MKESDDSSRKTPTSFKISALASGILAVIFGLTSTFISNRVFPDFFLPREPAPQSPDNTIKEEHKTITPIRPRFSQSETPSLPIPGDPAPGVLAPEALNSGDVPPEDASSFTEGAGDISTFPPPPLEEGASDTPIYGTADPPGENRRYGFSFANSNSSDGTIWFAVIPQAGNESVPHHIKATWGDARFEYTYYPSTPLTYFTVSYSPIYPNSLEVETYPAPASVDFGTDDFPNGIRFDSDGFWTTVH